VCDIFIRISSTVIFVLSLQSNCIFSYTKVGLSWVIHVYNLSLLKKLSTLPVLVIHSIQSPGMFLHLTLQKALMQQTISKWGMVLQLWKSPFFLTHGIRGT
jgi:hypothetical protein